MNTIIVSTANWGPLTHLLLLVCVIGAVLVGIGALLEQRSARTRRIVAASAIALVLALGVVSQSDAMIPYYWPFEWWGWCFCLSLFV